MKLTPGAFAEICGIKTKDLSVYKGRGQVMVENGEIDTDNPINAKFLERKLAKYLKSNPIEPLDQSDLKATVEKAVSDGETITKLKKQELIAYIQKTRAQINLLTIKIEKIKGEIVPVNEVSELFRIHTQSIFSVLTDANEEMLADVQVETNFSTEKIAKYRKRLTEGLRSAVDRATLMTNKSMAIITSNFSMTKGVGEHE